MISKATRQAAIDGLLYAANKKKPPRGLFLFPSFSGGPDADLAYSAWGRVIVESKRKATPRAEWAEAAQLLSEGWEP